MSGRILPARDYVKPEAEDAETQAEWEAMQRIRWASDLKWRAEDAAVQAGLDRVFASLAVPYDCEKL